MRNKLFKMATFILAMLMCLICIFKSGGDKVYAELFGTQDIGVLFAYGGTHPDLTLQGGWTKTSSGNSFAVWYTTADRKVMYCLEPGTPRTATSTADRKDANYIRNNISNRFLNGTQIERFIGTIMACGYTGTIDGGQDVMNLGYFADSIKETGASNTTQLYEACQILIWETVVGERNANFDYVAPDAGYSPCRAIHTIVGDTGNVFDTYYDFLVRAVKNYHELPDYLYENFEDARNMDPITPDANGYFRFENVGFDPTYWSFVVIDDQNNHLNASITMSGQNFYVRLPSGVDEAYLCAWNKVSAYGAVAWSSDGTWSPGSSSQDLVSCNMIDPTLGYCKLARETGTLDIYKESDYGVVQGLNFNVYYRNSGDSFDASSSRGTLYQVQTDENGHASLEGLPLGWYEIEEVVPDYVAVSYSDYDALTSTGNAVVRVDDSTSSASIIATNNVSAVIHINKTDEVTGEAIGYTSFCLYEDLNNNGYIDSFEENTGRVMEDSDGDGIIEFEGISIGTYLLAEAESYGLYPINDEVKVITVTSPERYVVNYTNNVFGSVTITKVDGDDHDYSITESIFELYVDTNGDGIYEEESDPLYDVIEDINQDGVYYIDDLPRQCYLIREIATADDYEIDPSVYPFEISIDELDVTIGNSTSELFENYHAIYGTDFMTLSGGDTGVIEYGSSVVLVDHVNYQHLIPGLTYELTLNLWDSENEEYLLDEDGNILTVNHEFVPQEESGTAYVTVTIDTTILTGRTIVAFERMYRDGHQVGSHMDPTDDRQSISIPDIGTTATSNNGDKSVLGNHHTMIVDTVSYENLIPGREYRAVGVLIDKETGEEYLVNNQIVTAETIFVPETSSGTVRVVFEFDASRFSGDLVVFEDLFDVESGLLVAVHRDISSCDQTIMVFQEFTPTPTPTPTPAPEVPSTGEKISYTNVLLATLGGTFAMIGAAIIVKYTIANRRKEE